MSQAHQTRFECSGCGKTYGWKPELAGKRVKCKCGTVITVPKQDEPSEDDLYDLVPDESAAPPRAAAGAGGSGDASATGMRCPACQASLQPGAVLCVNCGYNLKTGKKISTNTTAAATVAAAGAQAPMPTAMSGAGAMPGGMMIPPRLGPKSLQKTAVTYDEGSKRKMIMLGVGAVVLVGLLVGGVMLMNRMGPSEQLSEYDRAVQNDLNDTRAIPIDEWMQYNRFQAVGMDKKRAKSMADAMLERGAVQVMLPSSTGSMWMVAVLPEDPERRSKVFEYVNDYHTRDDPMAPRLVDEGQKYLKLRLRLFPT